MTSVLLSIGGIEPRDGGPTRSVTSLAQALVVRGDDAVVVTCGSSARSPAGQAVNARFVSYGLIAPRAMRHVLRRPFRRALIAEARRRDTRLIHDNGVWLQTNHAAAQASTTLGIPRIVSPRGMLEPWPLGHHQTRKRLAWRWFQHEDLETAAVLHATSELEASNLRALGLRAPIAIVPNGVTIPHEIRSQRRRRGPERTALFLSRVHPKKGLLDLVEAWAAVRPSNWRVRIVGPDENDHREEVRRVAAARGVASAFEFLPEVDDAGASHLFEEADLFVLPSRSENFGIVVGEALGHAVPVITTTATPWTNLTEWGCGWTAAPNAGALADALRDATGRSDAELRSMGERGRIEVEHRYSWASVADEMSRLYRWVLHGGEVPSCLRRP